MKKVELVIPRQDVVPVTEALAASSVFHLAPKEYTGIAPADLSNLEIRPDLIAAIPAELATKHRVLPIDKDGEVLTVGMVSHLDEDAVRELEAASGSSVKR